MTNREKVLAALVTALLVTVAAVYALLRVKGQFGDRRGQIAQLERDLFDNQRVIRAGEDATKRLEAYGERSLPSDITLARSLYKGWLLEKAVEVGFTDPRVNPTYGRPSGDVYYQHGFVVSGKCDLRKMAQFLFALRNSGHLHRIGSLTAKLIGRSKQIDLTIQVEALSMIKATDRQQLHEPGSNRLAGRELSEYTDAIVTRNMFSAANNPPQLASLSTQTGHPGRPLRFKVKGEDQDELDELTYSRGDPWPDGASISETGDFEWTPDELGEYEAAVCVTDNGLPAKTSTQTFEIAVVEPPPPSEEPAPEPTFDLAKHSLVTGITETSGQCELWVTVQTEGRLLILREGDPLDVGSVQGVVSTIRTREAEIRTKDGQVIIVGLGKSLRPVDASPLGGL